MADGWQADKRWADRFVGEIAAICGRHLIGPAPSVEDRLHNTDLVVLTMRDVRIACRIRRHQYLARYPDEFTIRGGRYGGNETELAKIVAGWGDYFFYGYADAEARGLAAWFLGDLRVFRLWFARQMFVLGGATPGVHVENFDESSWFYAYQIAALPADFVVARQTADPDNLVATVGTEAAVDVPFVA